MSYQNFPHDGEIIDLEDYLTYQEFHLPGSKNIPYDKLMLHYKEYLNKNVKYYLYCSKGRKSKKAVAILQFYGYNVAQITK